MKRGQITRHRLIWLMMGPILALIIIASLQVRPAATIVDNETLPAFLTGESG